MTATTLAQASNPTSETCPADPELSAAVDAACRRIAPTWPLDQFIAVNPWWGYVDKPIGQASATLAAGSGTRVLMPRTWYREAFVSGSYTERHVALAIEHARSKLGLQTVIASLEHCPALPPPRSRMTDIADATRDLTHQMPWCSFVTHNVSQFCGAFFDQGQSSWSLNRTAGLYPTWRKAARHDLSPKLLMGLPGFGAAVTALPAEPLALIAAASDGVGVPLAERGEYYASLLMSVNGWASWCAYLRWQARLREDDDDHLVHLLAIRLAWEWVLAERLPVPGSKALWQSAMAHWPDAQPAAAGAQEIDWLLQHACEIAYQEQICADLLRAVPPTDNKTPALQAAFCIDVRSEVFRRALEAESPQIRTLGFAGFFGLPIEYAPLATSMRRPQLPGLLGARLQVRDISTEPSRERELAARRRRSLDLQQSWKQFKTASVSAFSFVESIGIFYAAKLLTDDLGRTRPVPQPELGGLGADASRLKPRLAGRAGDGAAIDLDERVSLAAGILGAMSLTAGFSRIVLLAGHGSETVNNPHAAGLDCGACCGQTGEINARALASLLNDAEVRAGLNANGIEIPVTTVFIPGLHNTTTDEVRLHDLDEIPASHRGDLQELSGWLARAGARARAERAALLGLAGTGELADRSEDSALQAAMSARARDWAQVRPEWGLANNAAFIIAPRSRTRHMKFDGRAFLHEYDWRTDRGNAVLELIMTAPMVVTHWINMQYYASTVDNVRYGSGNKVLHNVVGGNIGVFEGNGGDLRIGLPMQSLHNGERWMHTPLRLSVFIEAPRAAIEGVLTNHSLVRDLVGHGWLHLFQIASDGRGISQYRHNAWTDVHKAAAPEIAPSRHGCSAVAQATPVTSCA